jgi:hypothetical protein
VSENTPYGRLTKAAVNEHVSVYMTPKGVRMWWLNKSWQLDGLTPAQAWEQGYKQQVYDYAVGGREQTAT